MPLLPNIIRKLLQQERKRNFIRTAGTGKYGGNSKRDILIDRKERATHRSMDRRYATGSVHGIKKDIVAKKKKSISEDLLKHKRDGTGPYYKKRAVFKNYKPNNRTITKKDVVRTTAKINLRDKHFKEKEKRQAALNTLYPPWWSSPGSWKPFTKKKKKRRFTMYGD